MIRTLALMAGLSLCSAGRGESVSENGLPPVIFGTGENGRDFTYVTETVRGIALAASCDALVGRAVNVAYGEMVTVRQVAEAIARLCGKPGLAPRFIEPRAGWNRKPIRWAAVISASSRSPPLTGNT